MIQQALGALCGVATLPLVVALAVWIRVDSEGPAIYHATRVGRGGRVFTCFKLRTMIVGESHAQPRITMSGDRRITQAGRILRRYRLDELLQFWNIARGEMAFVGPRPEDPRFVDLGNPLQAIVLSATPGMTGVAQLAYHNEAVLLDSPDPESAYRSDVLPDKLRLDAAYVQAQSLSLDAWIIAQTALTVLGHPPSRDRIERRL